MFVVRLRSPPSMGSTPLRLVKQWRQPPAWYQSETQFRWKHSGDWRNFDSLNMKMNHTNSYLSWTRNCFLCTVIGVAIYEQKELFSRSDISARTFFGLGFLNLAIGSYQHIEGAYRYQQALCLSRAALFGISAYTISGAILWIVGIAIYLS